MKADTTMTAYDFDEPDVEYQTRLNELSIRMHGHLQEAATFSSKKHSDKDYLDRQISLATMYASAISALGVIHEEKLRERAADRRDGR